MTSLCYNWINKFSGDYTCEHGRLLDYACSCMLLGALTKHLKRLRLLSRRPMTPFDSWSLDSVTHDLTALRPPHWGSISGWFSHKERCCSFLGTLIPEVTASWCEVQGLNWGTLKIVLMKRSVWCCEGNCNTLLARLTDSAEWKLLPA
jgi:hypothetical protein